MFMSWRSVSVWIYFMDEFFPTRLSLRDLVRLYDEGELKPFSIARELVSKRLGIIHGVRLYKTYYNPEKQVAVLEYLVEAEHGEASVKLIGGNNPTEALKEYYLHEQINKSMNHF